MNPLVKALPNDSALHHWLQWQSVTEAPVAFDVGCGLTALSASLGRECWVDQMEWKVYPPLSAMLVGPSGIGKNTAINAALRLIKQTGLRVIGGKTIEMIQDQAAKLGDPAWGVIAAKELSALAGTKDYQSGIIPGLTELLETEESLDISIKSDGAKRLIRNPTLTMFAGSTKEWIHKALPASAQEGGFFGRYMILNEEKPKRMVALVKRLPPAELALSAEGKVQFLEFFLKAPAVYKGFGEFGFTDSGEALYQEWYQTRESMFSTLAADYANRSRDLGLRIAMLCAVSRGTRVLDREDVVFALTFLEHIGKSVDAVLAPPSIEAKIARLVLKMLPARRDRVLWEMAKAYSPRQIKDALNLLEEASQVRIEHGTYYRKDT